jgi:hypothetical protein
MIDDTSDRAEIHDLFNRYADGTAGRQWELLDEVFTEDVTGTWLGSPEIRRRAALVQRIRDAIERTSETRLLGNYTATIDGNVAQILGSFRATLVRTWNGWRFRHLGAAQSAKLGAPEPLPLGRRVSVHS